MPSPHRSEPPAAPPRHTDTGQALHNALNKALRHALAAQLQRLGTLDARQPAQVQAVLADLLALLDRLATHQRLATDHLHPALETRQPGLTRQAARHGADSLAAASALRALASQVGDCPDAARRALLLARLYQTFTACMVQQLQRMAHEEQVLAPQVQALIDDAEQRSLQRLALASVPRWERLAGLLLMADGLNPDELAAVLCGQREHSSPDAWLAMVMAVQGRVGATRWAAIAARLDTL